MNSGLLLGVKLIEQLVKTATGVNAVPGELTPDALSPTDAYRADLEDLYNNVATKKPLAAKESTPRVVATPF